MPATQPLVPTDEGSLRARWGTASVAEIKNTVLAATEKSILSKTVIALGLLIFAQKLAVPPNIELGFFVIALLVAWLFIKGYAAIAAGRCITYCGICALMLLANAFSPLHNRISVNSLLFLLTVHIPFVFTVRISRAGYLRLLLWFQIFCLVIATAVYLQWLQQFLHMPMLDMDSYLPAPVIFEHYNYVQKVNFSSPWYKPNGFFMLEASFASQLLAMSVLVEIALFRRPLRILYVLAAQLATFGGTGMFVLGVGMIGVMFYLKPKSVLALLLAVPIALGAAYQLGVVKNATGRAAEVFQPGTSGHGRFAAPGQIALDTVKSSTAAAYLGLGAGVVSPYQTHETDTLNPIAKLVIEYGIPIALLFIIWFHSILLTSGVPFIVTLAVILQYDLTGGGLMIPLQTYYCLLLSALFIPFAALRPFDPGVRQPRNLLRPPQPVG